MNFILAFSDESQDSFHSRSLKDMVKTVCKQLENDDSQMHSPLAAPDYETLVQSTLRILSQKMSQDSTFTRNYKIVCPETPAVSYTNNTDRWLTSSSYLPHSWTIEQKSFISSVDGHTNNVNPPSEQRVHERSPPPAHTRPAFQNGHWKVPLNNCSTTHDLQDKASTTQFEALDLTKTTAQREEEASVSAQASKLIVVTNNNLEQYGGSSDHDQPDVSENQHSLNDEMNCKTNSSSRSESVNLSINDLYEEQDTEYILLRFCASANEEHNTNEVQCSCLSSGAKHSSSETDLNGTKCSVSLASDEKYTTSNLHNGHILLSNTDNSEVLSTSISIAISHEESHTRASNRESVSAPLSETDISCFLEAPNTPKALLNSSEHSLSSSYTMVKRGNSTCTSSNVTRDCVESLQRSNDPVIETYEYDDSKRIPVFSLHESENRSENMVSNAQETNEIMCTDSTYTVKENINMTISDYDDDGNVSQVIAEHDSQCYDADVSQDNLSYSDPYSDIELPVFNGNNKLNETYRVEVGTWSIKNVTETQSPMSLKIKLHRKVTPVSLQSQQTTDIVQNCAEPTNSDSTNGLSLVLDTRPERESLVILEQNLELTESVDESISSCLSYPSTPEIDHAGFTCPDNLKNNSMYRSVHGDSVIKNSSTPLTVTSKQDRQNDLKMDDGRNERQGQRMSPKCHGADSVLNMGFLVKNKKWVTYQNSETKKEIEKFSNTSLPVTSKSNVAKTRRKFNLFKSIKHKFLCGKSDVSFQVQDISKGECLDHFAASTNQQPRPIKGILKNAGSSGKGQQGSNTCNKLQGNRKHPIPNESKNHPCSNLSSSPQIHFNKQERFVSQKYPKKVRIMDTEYTTGYKLENIVDIVSSQSVRDDRAISLHDQCKNLEATSNFSSPVRTTNVGINTNIYCVPSPGKNYTRLVSETKVTTFPTTIAHNLWDSPKEDQASSVNESRAKSNSLKMLESDHVFPLSKNNQEFPEQKTGQCLPLGTARSSVHFQDMLMVNRQSTLAAEMLASFLSDKTVTQLETRITDDIFKKVLSCLCLRCGIKVTTSETDQCITTLHKSQNSRLPTKQDVKQVVRKTRRER